MGITTRVSMFRLLMVFAALLASIRPADAQRRPFVMVSIGDSFAAGLGDPNVPAPYGSGLTSQWNDPPCWRSWNAPALRAVAKLESLNTSLKFAPGDSELLSINRPPIPHFACAAATVPDLIDHWQSPPNIVNAPIVKPQIMNLTEWLTQRRVPVPVGTENVVDALIISVGGNDVHFYDIAMIASARSEVSVPAPTVRLQPFPFLVSQMTFTSGIWSSRDSHHSQVSSTG